MKYVVMKKSVTSSQQGLTLNNANIHFLFEYTSLLLISILSMFSLSFDDVCYFVCNRKGSVLYMWQRSTARWK